MFKKTKKNRGFKERDRVKKNTKTLNGGEVTTGNNISVVETINDVNVTLILTPMEGEHGALIPTEGDHAASEGDGILEVNPGEFDDEED